MQVPVVLGDVFRIEDARLVLQRVLLREAVADEFGVDGAVDDHVGHVHAARAEFPRHALGQRADAVLGAGEGGEVGRAAQAGGGAGEQDGAALAGDHAPGHLAAAEEAGEAGHFPDLEVLARGLVEDAAGHVGADVEDEGLDRADVALDGFHQLDDFLFLARIGGEAMGLAALGTDGVHQRLQLVRRTAGDAGYVAFAGEAPGDGPAGGIAGADHQHDFLLVVHGALSWLNDR
ncbi:hypothetical protein D3C76_1235840 [compost metagenome]